MTPLTITTGQINRSSIMLIVSNWNKQLPVNKKHSAPSRWDYAASSTLCSVTLNGDNERTASAQPTRTRTIVRLSSTLVFLMIRVY